MSVYSCLVPSLAQTGIHWGRNVLVTTAWLRQWYSWHTAAAQWVNRCWMNREIKVACRQTGCLVIGVNKWWESRQSWKGKLESNCTGASVCWLLRRPFNLFQDKFPARKLSSSFLPHSFILGGELFCLHLQAENTKFTASFHMLIFRITPYIY